MKAAEVNLQNDVPILVSTQNGKWAPDRRAAGDERNLRIDVTYRERHKEATPSWAIISRPRTRRYQAAHLLPPPNG
jgi:hypothetical protein